MEIVNLSCCLSPSLFDDNEDNGCYCYNELIVGPSLQSQALRGVRLDHRRCLGGGSVCMIAWVDCMVIVVSVSQRLPKFPRGFYDDVRGFAVSLLTSSDDGKDNVV